MLSSRRAAPGDVPACTGIVRGLPEYLTDDVPAIVERDLAQHEGWVIEEQGRVVGFVVVERRSPGAAEILWMAVQASQRGRGVGTRLLGSVLGELRLQGVLLVETKTLGGSADYEPYIATRAFWEHMGFVQIDTIDPLPGWQPGNPAAIYVAALGPTH
jgi:GNAT superfamily N-acetyltransferase